MPSTKRNIQWNATAREEREREERNRQTLGLGLSVGGAALSAFGSGLSGGGRSAPAEESSAVDLAKVAVPVALLGVAGIVVYAVWR